MLENFYRFSAELPDSEGGSGFIYWNPCNDISPPDCADEQAGSGEVSQQAKPGFWYPLTTKLTRPCNLSSWSLHMI